MEDLLIALDLYFIPSDYEPNIVHDDYWDIFYQETLEIICFSLSSIVASMFMKDILLYGLLDLLEKIYGVKSSKSKKVFWVDEL